MGQIVSFESRQKREIKDRQRYFKESFSKGSEQKRMLYNWQLKNLLTAFYENRIQENYDALMDHLKAGLMDSQFVMINVNAESGIDVEPIYGTDNRWYFGVYTDVETAEQSPNRKIFPQVYRVQFGLMMQEILYNESMGGICLNPHQPEQCIVPREYIRIFYEEWQAITGHKDVLEVASGS